MQFRAPCHARKSNHGFTLLEIMGVLAVILILSSMSFPVLFGKMVREQRLEETKNLKKLSETYLECVVADFELPSNASWASILGDDLGWHVDKVNRNQGGWPRRLLIDPLMRLGNLELGDPNYIQSNYGSPRPDNLRLVLVSSLTGDLPASDDQIPFDIWFDGDSQSILAASDLGSEMRPDDLMVQPIFLGHLFHRLILSNLDNDPAPFTINDAPLTHIPGNNLLDSYYLEHSKLSLCLSDGTVQLETTIQDADSFIYQNGRWNRQFHFMNQQVDQLASKVNAFLASKRQGKFSVEPRDVITEFHSFLLNYSLWASENFPLGGTSSQQVPEYRRSYDAQFRLFDFIDHLLKGE